MHWSHNMITSTREHTTCAWIRADICPLDGAISSKNSRNIIGARRSQDLRPPSPIMVSGRKRPGNLILGLFSPRPAEGTGGRLHLFGTKSPSRSLQVCLSRNRSSRTYRTPAWRLRDPCVGGKWWKEVESGTALSSIQSASATRLEVSKYHIMITC